MNEIKNMENVLASYNKARAQIKNQNEKIKFETAEVEREEKNIEKELMSLQVKYDKEEERLNEAINDYGENPLNDYESDVIKEYKNNFKMAEGNLNRAKEGIKERIAEKKNSIEESKKEVKAKQEEMKKFASQENIVTINVGLKALDKQMQEKQVELKMLEEQKQSALKMKDFELQQFYMKEDKEGKIAQDFYREQDAIKKENEAKQDAIKKEIENIQKEKDKYTRFLDVLKNIRDKEMQSEIDKINHAISNRHPVGPSKEEQNEVKSDEQTTKNVIEDNKQKVEFMNNLKQEIENPQFNAREDARSIHFNDDMVKPAKVIMPQNVKENKMQKIEINAKQGKIFVTMQNSKEPKAFLLQRTLREKKELFEKLNMKEVVNNYCKENDIGFFGKLGMYRKMDPAVIKAIQQYADDPEIYNYLGAISGKEQLNFNIHYDLRDSMLEDKNFKLMNKLAKRGRNIEGITAEGVKENIIDRMIKSIKQKTIGSKETPKAITDGSERTSNQKNELSDRIEVSNEVKENLQKVEQKAQKEQENPNYKRIVVKDIEKD